LNASTFETSYQPVPVEEYLVYEGQVYPASTTKVFLKTASQLGPEPGTLPASLSPIKRIEPSTHKEMQDNVLNAVISLANETASQGYGVLVFCSSRQSCESNARLISRVLLPTYEQGADLFDPRQNLLSELRGLPTGLDPTLADTIPWGVAFHHAGLTAEERELIADAYDSGVLKVIVATCSLAAGINLPARRVILHSARMGRDLVGPAMLRQMRGRAGRKGRAEIGETYLCCRKTDLEDIVELMHAELPPLSSGLVTDTYRMQRALLEIIAIRLADSDESIEDYTRKTLLRLTTSEDAVRKHVKCSLEWLQDKELVTTDTNGTFSATQLGKAVVTSSLSPEDGIFLSRELRRALQAFVLDGEMHVLYTFTPVQDLFTSINWQCFRKEVECFDESALRVMAFLGVKPTLINKLYVVTRASPTYTLRS
jgi:replicative superfamily II helicase